MNVDVTINIRYDRTEVISTGRTVVTTENITISDNIPEETVISYVDKMRPVSPDIVIAPTTPI